MEGQRMQTSAPLQIRQLAKLEEFSEAVRLQKEIWGFQDVDLLPLRLFVVASKIGGQVLGAFDGSKMVAFCLCIPGLKPGGKSYLHSHMMGVLPQYRNHGLGRRLKWSQREYALGTGVDLVEWTFDPLEIKNAFLNIVRLGAVVRRYVHNQYGRTSSHLHSWLPTDRLIAEWWLNSDRVLARSAGATPISGEPQARISVPINIHESRQRNPEEAIGLQTSIAEQFEQCFSAGLAVTGFEKTSEAGVYLLSEWK
jgi:predicted GNAT superfamily acetyltransferase